MRKIALLLAVAAPLYADAPKTPPSSPPSKPAPKPWEMKDQDDSTDTLAIPLDSSEEEERQEEQQLNKIKPPKRP